MFPLTNKLCCDDIAPQDAWILFGMYTPFCICKLIRLHAWWRRVWKQYIWFAINCNNIKCNPFFVLLPRWVVDFLTVDFACFWYNNDLRRLRVPDYSRLLKHCTDTETLLNEHPKKTLADGGDVECRNIRWQRTTLQINGWEVVWIVKFISASVGDFID